MVSDSYSKVIPRNLSTLLNVKYRVAGSIAYPLLVGTETGRLFLTHKTDSWLSYN